MSLINNYELLQKLMEILELIYLNLYELVTLDLSHEEVIQKKRELKNLEQLENNYYQFIFKHHLEDKIKDLVKLPFYRVQSDLTLCASKDTTALLKRRITINLTKLSSNPEILNLLSKIDLLSVTMEENDTLIEHALNDIAHNLEDVRQDFINTLLFLLENYLDECPFLQQIKVHLLFLYKDSVVEDNLYWQSELNASILKFTDEMASYLKELYFLKIYQDININIDELLKYRTRDNTSSLYTYLLLIYRTILMMVSSEDINKLRVSIREDIKDLKKHNKDTKVLEKFLQATDKCEEDKTLPQRLVLNIEGHL